MSHHKLRIEPGSYCWVCRNTAKRAPLEVYTMTVFIQVSKSGVVLARDIDVAVHAKCYRSFNEHTARRQFWRSVQLCIPEGI